MKRLTLLSSMILLFVAVPAFSQTGGPQKEIEKTVLNYAEGWYEGDASKMESSLHPDLAKRTVETNEKGRSRINELSSLGLVQVTRPGYGKSTPEEKRLKAVRILDVFNNMATVRLEMADWVDYMHLAKFNGKWVIVNVLWEPKPKDGNAGN